MTRDLTPTWHLTSYRRCLDEGLPRLLAERLPLATYHVDHAAAWARVTVGVTAAQGPVVATWELPEPSAEGVFVTARGPRVVAPVAAHDDLATAAIACVGEQLLALLEARLGQAPPHLPWDEEILRAWLPLDTWVTELLDAAQPLDESNPLARLTHPRRLRLAEAGAEGPVIRPSHRGRVCPLETPEGERLGRWLSVARGAAIRDGRLLAGGDDLAEQLGLAAACVPFVAHSESTRLLMGVNTQRQWLPPDDPEPALVQTGLEPDDPAFWCGRNLLTAFCSLGADTFEDALVLSESAAARLAWPADLEPGDKLSNRHGTKGVVSRILPDAAMPHLPDGTPVELVFSFLGCHSRLNHGQLLEAAAGRLARAAGAPVIAAPGQGPLPEELRRRLAAAGLPPSGQERLTLDGEPLELPTTVGWVYWGRLPNLAAAALRWHPENHPGMRQGWLDHASLREIGCQALPAEWSGLAAADRPEAASLAAVLAAGDPRPWGPPTPGLAALTARLAVAGIAAEVTPVGLAFRWETPERALVLAAPVPHPWRRDRSLAAVGPWRGRAWRAVVEADERLRRLLSDGAPEVLRGPAHQALATAVERLLDGLIARDDLSPGGRVAFSGKAVLAPGGHLAHDQVALPADLCWGLFGPLAARRVPPAAVAERAPEARAALDQAMAESWVVITRAPALERTNHLACRPVLGQDRVIRLHPRANMLLNADHDGDQVAVLLPLTAAGQREAAERLTMAAHVAREARLIDWIQPPMEARWGLAWLSLRPDGRRAIAACLGFEPPVGGVLTRSELAAWGAQVLRDEGWEKLGRVFDDLTRLGFAAARRSGASLAPFAGEAFARPPQPSRDDAGSWTAYAAELTERLTAATDYDDPDLGPQLLAVKSGSRGVMRHLIALLGGDLLIAAAGQPVPACHSLPEGLDPDEVQARAAVARAGLVNWERSWVATRLALRDGAGPRGLGVLARAWHAERPGQAFAQAALTGEVDPLTDPVSRQFVGL